MLNPGNRPHRKVKTMAEMVREAWMAVRAKHPAPAPLTPQQREWLNTAARLPPELAEPAGLHKTYEEALRGLRDEEFLAGHRHKEQHWRAIRKGADARLVGVRVTGPHGDKAVEKIVEPGFEQKFLRKMAKMGVPMFAHCVVRPNGLQDELFKAGHSKARAGESPHNYGLAIDLIHGTKGWQLSRQQWDLIGHVGKEIAAAMGIELEWGGDWKFYDPAHWEIKDWRSLL